MFILFLILTTIPTEIVSWKSSEDFDKNVDVPDNTDISIHRSYKRDGIISSTNKVFERAVKHFDENSHSTLIVIDTERDDNDDNDVIFPKDKRTRKNKKSNIEKENSMEEKFSDGFTIVVDKNGDKSTDRKKDEIYREMENNYEEIQQKFAEVIKQPLERKHVRLIVITPKVSEDMHTSSNKHTVDESLSVSKNKELKNKNIMNDETGNVSELEIDIAKLKKVRDEMNHLQEIKSASSPSFRSSENTDNLGALSTVSKNDDTNEINSQKTETQTSTPVVLNKLKEEKSGPNLETDNVSAKSDGFNNTDMKNGELLYSKHKRRHAIKLLVEPLKINGTVNKEESFHHLGELDQVVKYKKLLPPSNPHPDDNKGDNIIKPVILKHKSSENGTRHIVSAYSPTLIFKNLTNKANIITKDHANIKNISKEIGEKSHATEETTKYGIKIKATGNDGKAIGLSDELSSGNKITAINSNAKLKNGKLLKLLRGDKIIDNAKSQAIIEFLNKDPLETWRFPFNTLTSLDLNATLLRSGLVNPGDVERLKGVMRRALSGQDITMSIVGGSISAGGGLYKDLQSIEGLYFKGVVDWWNKMIKPLTGSSMLVNNIAIGSIGTDYFSYCINNHIWTNTDIVLWELSANDFNRYKLLPTKGARPLERFTRIVLGLPKKPALIYLNFFKGIDYKNSKDSCPNFEDQEEDVIAHYYKIPSLSWRAMVCKGLLQQQDGFLLNDLFSQDQYHPSLKGHAQASLLILLHLRHIMRAVLQWAIQHNGILKRFEDLYAIPEPLFMGPKFPEPLCWTLISPNISDQIKNSLQVRVMKDEGFLMEYATNFPIRYDKVACWKAEKPYAIFSIMFIIPDLEDDKKYELAITTHTRWGGASSVWIDDDISKAITVSEGRFGDPGKRTQVDTISNDISPGIHTLNIQSSDRGFCLASIMVDSS